MRVTANYPGASAQKCLENTVTQVIEQNMTGLDNLMYMSSQQQWHRSGICHFKF
ncbi:efflux RND transporter permease subunit [Escherichia coli]